MKRLLLSLSILLTFFTAGFALDINGEMKVDLRMSLSNQEFIFNQETLALKFEHSDGENLNGVFQLDFIYYNGLMSSATFDASLLPGDMGVFYTTYPFEISVNEAYFTYSGFLFKDLDLTVGKQRIAWGTATMLNPTDILNPSDLSDPFDFSRRISTLAINALYYLPFAESSLQLIYEPFSQPARLDFMFFEQLEGMLSAKLSSGFIGMNYSDVSAGWEGSTIEVPEMVLTNGLYAAKYAFSVWGFDMGLNFVSRMNDFPVPVSINGNLAMDVDAQVDVSIETIIVQDTVNTTNVTTNGMAFNTSTNATMNSHSYKLGYGRELEAGFEFSKDIGGFLLWGEVGVFLPEEMSTRLDMLSDATAIMNVIATNTVVVDTNTTAVTNFGITNQMITNIVTTNSFQMSTTESQVAISNLVSVKYVLGVDRSFNNNWYGNFQYIHGLSKETGNWGPNRLQDYFMLVIRKTAFSDKLEFNLGGIYSINTLKDAFDASDFKDYVTNNYGAFVQFAIAYLPTPDLKVEIGTYLMDGKNSTLAYMKDSDMIFTKFTYSF